MKPLSSLTKSLTTMALSPLVLMSYLVAKNQSIWVFGAWHGHQYADNPRYLFETIASEGSGIQPIWISKSRSVVKAINDDGFRAYYWISPKGIFYSLRASVAVVSHSADDVNPYASYRAKVFKITHGTPMKRMGVDSNASRRSGVSSFFYRNIRERTPQRRSPLIAFVSSELSKQRFESAYAGGKTVVINSGYPRWKGILENRNVLWQVIGKEANLRRGDDYDKIIMYAPTRRASSKFRLRIGSDFAAFVSNANLNGYFVILRPHPSLIVDLESDAAHQLKGMGFLELTCKQLEDINSALHDVDILITDYSSIIYDFCILGRPVFLYAPDLEEYIAEDTGLYAPYGESEPALKIDCLDDVLDEQWIVNATSKAAYFQSLHERGSAMEACSRIVRDIKENI
ncbi:CDP-glycerol glycerophosphotransferase family protein [Halomonas heilongjiangensis]|uniref:Uncharacterized protein n=1 Tax=Halomonas heilongjiangensis TaxID=1387883 RepID=A0A2N7TUN3_9GAMM|nr:CDP-glycerol glycerophosphotransferase family protein [Halomonas heilongjiangensis]PMR71868.1 hypothetical protein C1H66_01095 [Halomonas heilongjiangensis]PXX87669.1 hypothetical protein CR158_17860 [Halomonas heilongjiangensis]